MPIGYAKNPYTALPDATGYHLLDGRRLHNRDYAGDYLDFWLRGAGTSGARHYSEWITSAAYQRYLVTGDAAQIKSALPHLIALYKKWDSNFTNDITVNGTQSTNDLYHQTPISDATEYTETSMKSSNWFSGGAGYRPTINAYMFSAAQAISKIATMNGDTATRRPRTSTTPRPRSSRRACRTRSGTRSATSSCRSTTRTPPTAP
ncbi:MGH1-like glycoside hydrolase domain-containing protein [Streptomyces albicerus]|uniref:MGH1-like glycoside hydrolase domain-containing protein n=1 Tax=Streptomyces albicerus TaxID=2569859 RepID=UPI003850EB1C